MEYEGNQHLHWEAFVVWHLARGFLFKIALITFAKETFLRYLCNRIKRWNAYNVFDIKASKPKIYYSFIHFVTSMHSSGTPTARRLTVSGGVGRHNRSGQKTPLYHTLPFYTIHPLWTDRRLWKHYLSAISHTSPKPHDVMLW